MIRLEFQGNGVWRSLSSWAVEPEHDLRIELGIARIQKFEGPSGNRRPITGGDGWEKDGTVLRKESRQVDVSMEKG